MRGVINKSCASGDYFTSPFPTVQWAECYRAVRACVHSSTALDLVRNFSPQLHSNYKKIQCGLFPLQERNGMKESLKKLNLLKPSTAIYGFDKEIHAPVCITKQPVKNLHSWLY